MAVFPIEEAAQLGLNPGGVSRRGYIAHTCSNPGLSNCEYLHENSSSFFCRQPGFGAPLTYGQCSESLLVAEFLFMIIPIIKYSIKVIGSLRITLEQPECMSPSSTDATVHR